MRPRDLILPYFKAQRWSIAMGLFSLILVDLLQLLIPRAIKAAVDDLTLLRANLTGLLKYAGAVAVMALLIGIFRYIWRRCLLGTARYLEADLRNRLLGHVQTLSAGYFDHTKTGELMAHATNDIMQVRMAAGMGLVALNDALVMGAAAIGFMLYIHVKLTLYVLIPMPLIAIGTRILSKHMHHHYQKVQAAFADLTETIRERYAGIHMIKAHNEEAAATRAVRAVSSEYVARNMRLVGITSIFFPLTLMLTNLSLAVVLFLGGRQTLLTEISTGDFVAFISYLNLLSWPMMALGWVANLIQRGGASLVRLNDILQRRPEITAPPNALRLNPLRGRIFFDQVTFSYDALRQRPALADITLEAAPGEILGIVGPPGSGKSTLLSLVPRLYDPTAGRVTMDGEDLRQVALDDLRRQVAYVPQEPFLFSGSVRENILFGCPDHCALRLDQAIDQAGLRDTVAAWPDGLETIVGKRGCCFPAASASVWPWPGPCSSTPPCCCWMIRSARWIRPRPP